MTDYQRIVDDIRSFLHSSDQTQSEALKELAVAYAGACQEANQRLRRCDEFLQKGLRSEAVHFADAEPVLLDVLAVLDFPERDQWEQLALTYGLPPAPKLRLETAEALNRAYAEEQPLEYLLKQHRLLALARGPLGERLALMRQIASVDTGNPVWAQDIGEFEKVRLQQIEKEADEALQHNEFDTLSRLWDEVQKEQWHAPIPIRLVNRLDSEVARRKWIQLRQSLDQLSVEMAKALTIFDEGKARRLRSEWDQLLREVNLLPQDSIWKRAAPTLKWLDELDRRQAQAAEFEAALTNLAEGMARGAKAEELQELYFAVRKFKRRIPPEVEEHYRDRMQDLSRSWRARERFILVTTFTLGVLLVVGLIVFLILNRR